MALDTSIVLAPTRPPLHCRSLARRPASNRTMVAGGHSTSKVYQLGRMATRRKLRAESEVNNSPKHLNAPQGVPATSPPCLPESSRPPANKGKPSVLLLELKFTALMIEFGPCGNYGFTSCAKLRRRAQHNASANKQHLKLLARGDCRPDDSEPNNKSPSRTSAHEAKPWSVARSTNIPLPSDYRWHDRLMGF